MSNYIVALVLRTFASVFPHMEIWDTQEGDLVMLGSKKPWTSNAAQYQKIFERPGVRKDLEQIKIFTGVALWARQIASQKTAGAITGDGPIQTDDVPILEYAAPKAFFQGAEATTLHLFDERTLQFPLANKAKLAIMRALPDNTLARDFQLSPSSNPDIRQYVSAVATKPVAPTNVSIPWGTSFSARRNFTGKPSDPDECRSGLRDVPQTGSGDVAQPSQLARTRSQNRNDPHRSRQQKHAEPGWIQSVPITPRLLRVSRSATTTIAPPCATSVSA